MADRSLLPPPSDNRGETASGSGSCISGSGSTAFFEELAESPVALAEPPVAGLVSVAPAEPPVAGLVSVALAEPPVTLRWQSRLWPA